VAHIACRSEALQIFDFWLLIVSRDRAFMLLCIALHKGTNPAVRD
jgi:hypothetical protein